MADDASSPSTALTVAPQRQLRTPVEDLIPVFDTSRFEHYGRIATVMAKASLVPDSLKGNNFEEAQANCFQVCELADRWGYSPFAVAQCASIVHGKLMIEGKLVAAVLDSKLGIELNHYYTGEWGKDDYRIYVTDADLTEEQINSLKPHIKIPGIRIVDGSVGEWKTKEKGGAVKGNWLSQPDVQLQYRGDRTWARLNKPAIMLGVITDDEMEDYVERQESRRPALSAGPDEAALNAARLSLVAPITPVAQEQAPTPKVEDAAKPEPEPVQKPDDDGATAPDSHAEPDPGDAQDAAKTTAPAGEVYLLAGEGLGEDGKRATYKDGKAFSRASEKAAARLKEYDLHAPEGEAEARPTETASALTAEAEPATSDSAIPASEPSPDPTASGGAASSASEPGPPASEEPQDAFFEDAPPEENEPLNPLLAGKIEIDGANSAQEIRAIINRVTATPEFKEASEDTRILIRQAGWERYMALKERGIEDGAVTKDVLLFFLWIEFGARSKKEIDDLWAKFFSGEVYKAVGDGWKRSLAALIARRKAVLP